MPAEAALTNRPAVKSATGAAPRKDCAVPSAARDQVQACQATADRSIPVQALAALQRQANGAPVVQRALLAEGGQDGKKGALPPTEKTLTNLVKNGANCDPALIGQSIWTGFRDDFERIKALDAELATASGKRVNSFRVRLKSEYDALISAIPDGILTDDDFLLMYTAALPNIRLLKSNNQIDAAFAEQWVKFDGRTAGPPHAQKVVARAEIRKLSGTRVAPPTAKVENQLRMGALKTRMTQRLRVWAQDHENGVGKKLYTGWIEGNVDNPHFITPAEYETLKAWWGTGPTAAYGAAHWVSNSESGGGEIRDLHASYTADTATGTNFVWHIRVKEPPAL